MNKSFLAQPPADADSYIQPPEHCRTPEEVEDWLREMLREAKFNLHFSDCFIADVENVSRELSKARYRVQCLLSPGSTARADFYLKRLPA